MELTELELSDGILKMSRNASVLAVFASGITLVNLPQVGLITYMGFGLLGLLILFRLKCIIDDCKNIKKINSDIEKNNIKTIRNMISSLMDEKLEEERNHNNFILIIDFIIAALFAMYGMRMKELSMGFLALTFGISGLSFGGLAAMYQRLINEVGIEEKSKTKSMKLKRGQNFNISLKFMNLRIL